MHPRDLTPIEIAELLAEAYVQDQVGKQGSLRRDTRTALANYLGCHEEVRAEVWALWRQEVADEDAAEYWPDVEFIQPCPQDQVHG